ncbi:Uncharacterised protein [Vibrio cholerae]|uniref:Uncharacterized protein n=1 Tax=Vibrio cholerae TaxID=666 RepID=A0A655ZGF6_VIBCL|nr:Uncharacterised protein [Vibrio cholerae]
MIAGSSGTKISAKWEIPRSSTFMFWRAATLASSLETACFPVCSSSILYT